MKRIISLLCLLSFFVVTVSAQWGGESLVLDASSLTMKVGDTYTFTVTNNGSPVNNNKCTWSMFYDQGVATVDANGTVTALAPGEDYVDCEYNSGGGSWGGGWGSSAYCTITVIASPLSDEELPFETTSVSGDFAAGTSWYILSIRKGKYLYYDENTGTILCTTTLQPSTEFLWCFSGDAENGIMIHNYAAGPDYHFAAGGIYSGEILFAQTATQGSSDPGTFDIYANGNGFTFCSTENTQACLNDYSDQSFIAYWVDSNAMTDNGGCIVITEVDPIEYGGAASGDVIYETSLALDVTNLSLSTGDTYQLTATLEPADATYQKITWKSSNPNCVSVSGGLLTAKSAGTAVITASSRNGLTATCTVNVTLNINTDGLTINEVQLANVDQYLDPSYNYGSWIELYNNGSKTINLDALFLTDSMEEPAKWPLHSLGLTSTDYSGTSSGGGGWGYNAIKTYTPHETNNTTLSVKGYKKVWFDHTDWRYPMMANFKLDQDGGDIYITDGCNIIAQASYPEAIARTSWARTTDGGDEWGYTSQPTPGTTNATSTFATERLEAPVVSTPSKIFTSGSINFTVTVPEGATLRFTTDGSAPTLTNGSVAQSNTFSTSETAIYRFVATKSDKLSSQVVTRSFIKPVASHTLPIMSLVTEEGNLYDSEYGIMTRGSNGRPGLGQSSASNWNQDWDRPANIEYFTKEGENVFNQETNVAICGGWSRAYEPYSFKVKGKKMYEHINYLPYAFFQQKPYIKNKTLQMRNGGNDNPGNGGTGRIKDAALQTVFLKTGLNIDGQSYQPVQLYRNGEYAGIINMREPNNRDLVYSNYGYDEEDVDQFEMDCDSAYVQSSGTKEAFEQWYKACQNCGTAEGLEELRSICDIEEFFNYMAIQCYLAMGDYGYNNVKGYRPRVENGKFRMVLFDLDSASDNGCTFNFTTNRSFNNQYEGHNGTQGTSVSGEIQFIVNWYNMLKNNAELRKQFVDQFCLVTGSVFNPEFAATVIDELVKNVSTAADEEYSFTGKYLSPSSVGNTLKNGTFASNRQNNAFNSLKNFSYVSTEAASSKAMTVTLSENNKQGRLFVNDLPVPTNAFKGTLFSPITLRAEAPAGYRFAGWSDETSGSTNTETPIFEEGSNWSYYDQGSLEGENWTAAGYTEDNWSDGNAPLGYSNNVSISTWLDYGGDSSNKRPTYYFRKKINLTKVPSKVTLNSVYDDGFVFYVNGEVAASMNMASTSPSYDEYANGTVGNYNTNSFSLDASLFQKGTNILAVEVHNNNATSTDIYWDASLTYASDEEEEPEGDQNYVSTEAEYKLSGNNITLQAVFVPLTAAETALTDGHPVKINEVSAANSIYVNDYFKKDDWVELYNTTGQDIDLDGYYISDKLTNATKYQISKENGYNTIIPAHGFKTIWCSKRANTTSAIHANFKLDNEDGKQIVLTAPDQSWCDTLTYKAMNGDETCGLYPDGGSNCYLFNQTTIEKNNKMTLIADMYDEHALEDNKPVGVDRLISQSNELSITFTGEELYVRNEYQLATAVTIYNAAGQLVSTHSLNMNLGYNTVDVSSLPAGTYVARAADGDETVATKFVIR